MRRIIPAIISLTLACCATSLNWGDLKTPSSGKPEAIGSYALGCLAGGQALEQGTGYEIMRPSRNRFYGQTELVKFIKNYASEFNAETGQTLLIGDMAQPRGGKIIGGHGSHQIGLDVDIWFLTLTNHKLTISEKENLPATFLVDKNGHINQDLWRIINIPQQLKTAANFPEVDRIFVNSAIKKQLCQTHKGEAWLNKIRPWWGHDEHFHVRLTCPADNADCAAQAPLPQGDGCDGTLSWWDSEEARNPASLSNSREQIFPKKTLPERCDSIMRE